MGTCSPGRSDRSTEGSRDDEVMEGCVCVRGGDVCVYGGKPAAKNAPALLRIDRQSVQGRR